MPADAPTILATSGGYRHGDRTLEFGPLVTHAVDLAGATGTPRVCYVGTAGGDQAYRAAAMHEAARLAGVRLDVLQLFSMPNVEDVAGYVLDHDVVWVDGGSVANLLAVWRVHGLDDVMRRAWESGVVLAGVSAGSICWHRGGVTDSFGPDLRPVTNGLGLLPYDNGVHYDSEASRRPAVHRFVAEGLLGETYCTDDGVGLHYRGTELVGAVSETRGAAAWVVRPDGGHAVEDRLDTTLLPGAR
ncbi:peptidase S51 dipeptidase E [Beutenbergia cavernae DSM 12333]|uniref:Peptidase S51 dipeptidase E n=1 Tax=Beutenbergia cavernae (strain ATCC BAA-8 / DSM 12333 / CCUG 43141 / JCM 11478 / NBRC 16432 / NCIMB 13614 / HKI 0122) TaxID=471853 RepID=C5C3H7_BEUC1|nr:peptidase E [Beutenbergia cavernae]ACQ79876.1 peptidase S51 dipeptidase E [Beutenbergia cavernae DSM 12333]